MGDESQPHLPSHTTATFQWMRGELLGQGSYGRVYMALNVSTGELMAVKQVEVQGDHKSANQEALKFLHFENDTLRELDHQNVVQYLAYEASPETLSVFLEYVPGGTIATLINKYGRFREEVTKSFTRQILDGLEYLHSRGILHRDLKPDNILVEPIGVCKISDFGISKRVDDGRAYTLMKGTVQYMAPEILGTKEKGYDGKIDIWSVGCMVMEMWTGEKPWGADENFMAIMVKLRETQSSPPLPAQLQKELSQDAHNFRDSCFHINPVQRPSAADLKQHPYLRLPVNWTFNENEIPHPSRERRIVNGRRQRGHQNEEVTYKPKQHKVDTIRPQDMQGDDNSTLRPHPKIPPRGPSPPIVVITPVPRPALSLAPSPSPVETQEQDNATSESSASSRRSRRKGKSKYRVTNPGGGEASTSYQYIPPPLPPAPHPYSARLGASSKHSLSYVPEPNQMSRTRSSSTPHSVPIPPPNSSSSSSYPLHPHSSSKSSASSTSSLPQSSGTEDSGTWKRPPTTAPLHCARPSSSSRYEQGSSPSGYHRLATQLRTPPPPSVPPPLPPLHTPPPSGLVPRTPPPLPLVPLPLPPSSSSYAPNTLPGTSGHRRGNRPNADDVVRHLGDYFPDHDLDQPVIVRSSSVDDFTARAGPASTFGNNEEQDTTLPDPSTSPPQDRTGNPASSRFSLIRPTSLDPLSFHSTGYTGMSNSAVPSTADIPSGHHANPRGENGIPSPVSALHGDGSRRLGSTKSIRRLAEEQVSKRQSNPDKARRRTLWDIKMEELKRLPPTPVSGWRGPPFDEDDF